MNAALTAAWLVAAGCTPRATDPADDAVACNGHAALCDRTLDDVTLPGTHNSMSNLDAGWIAANQQHGITRQLEDGIRALMLDTMEWNGEPHLCHGYCELGAQPLNEGLAEIEAFLRRDPQNVVAIIFQDGLPVDTMTAALEETGLADRAWTWDGAMPTLRELIAEGTQLVVTAEHKGPPPRWYHHAWDLFQDTPYSHQSFDDMTCEPNRGRTASPLLLVNHWVGTPLPTESGAAEVNAYEPLMERSMTCEAERDRRIAVLAVDFYNRGDLFDAVDTLNGID